MKSRNYRFAFILAIAATLWLAHRFLPGNPVTGASNTIDYMGQHIKLTKSYDSYEDYKDDPDNIDPSENARVANLVENAPVSTNYPTRDSYIHAMIATAFPGYGMEFFGEKKQPDGSVHELIEIEIPRTNRGRYLYFTATNGSYTLKDDFTTDVSKDLSKVKEEDGQLIYLNSKNAVVFVHKK